MCIVSNNSTWEIKIACLFFPPFHSCHQGYCYGSVSALWIRCSQGPSFSYFFFFQLQMTERNCEEGENRERHLQTYFYCLWNVAPTGGEHRLKGRSLRDLCASWCENLPRSATTSTLACVIFFYKSSTLVSDGGGGDWSEPHAWISSHSHYAIYPHTPGLLMFYNTP